MNNENQNIEYKRIWKDEYLKWVCGFANAQGGRIYIGIDDDGSVTGVNHLHHQMEDIPNKIVSLLGIVPEVNHIQRDDKDIIEIIVEPSNIPISYKGSFYTRSGATKQELRGTALHQFLLKKFGKSWEDMPCYGTTIDDIDPDAIAYFLRKGVAARRLPVDYQDSTPEEVISNLGLMEDGVPCNGAILLFGKYPQRKFVTSSFKIGRFGNANHDLLNQEIVCGNLIQMPERVMKVLDDRYLIRPIHYEGLQRIEPLELPEDALREILCNAIVHRDHQGTWTQMSIYSDHIRLWNAGTLPVDLTIEKLMGKHTSEPRNPKMAEAFYRAGFIEAWGRGIEKIINGFTNNGLSVPTIEIEQRGVMVTILREKFQAVNLGGTTDVELFKNKRDSSEKTDTKPIQTDTKPIQDYNTSDQKRYIINRIKSNPNVTMEELAGELLISKSSVQRRFDSLIKEECIRRIGSLSGGHWEVINIKD